MNRFAFVLHPLRISDITRKFPFLRPLPDRWTSRLFAMAPPFKVSHITGCVSAAGAQCEGWFVVVPMTPEQMLQADFRKTVLPRILRAGAIAEELGAQIVGLGAFLKVVGDRGVSVAAGLSVPVTTGNSYTSASALQGALQGAAQLGVSAGQARAAVLGATGAIGAACSRILAEHTAEVVLCARQMDRLELLKHELSTATAQVLIETDARQAVRDADIVIAVTSATDTLIEPEDLRPGAVVCDVARPRNISQAVYERREDVLVIDGGVIAVPGENLDFGLNFGFPPKHAEACIAETMLLALEGRFECFTLGGDIRVEKVREIARLADKHGFRVSGFRRFERPIPADEVDRIRRNARRPEPVTLECVRL